MTPQLITIVIRFDADVTAVECELARNWGNPVFAPADPPQTCGKPDPLVSTFVATTLAELGTIHFLGIHAVPGHESTTNALVFELAIDGSPRHALEQLSAALTEPLRDLFRVAGIEPLPATSPEIVALFVDHQQDLGLGWFATTGLGFCGTPGFTVKRILAEAKLAEYMTELVVRQRSAASAAEKLEQARATLWNDPVNDWKWVFESEACLSPQPGRILDAVLKGIGPLVRDLLWPLIVLPALSVALGVWLSGLWLACGLFSATVLGEIALICALYQRFRSAERTDLEDLEPADASQLEAIANLEDRAAQNHLIVLTPLKRGWLRRLSLRVAFFAIRQAAQDVYPAGKLSDIGTIHVARWIVLPKTSQLLFLSNYGGSWESYLEDFIIKAHLGLTGVWSNTNGFPKASNLFFDGAVRGRQFKTWARRQQRPTRCWFSAYPTLTTTRIRTHSEIRRGLAEAHTAAEAADWLALFGAGKPPNIELEQIPALVFGGLPQSRFGKAFLVQFHDRASATRWLRRVQPLVAFGEDPSRTRVLQVGFTAAGLRKLALDDDTLATFPPPFQHGSAKRGQQLGDLGTNAAAGWDWSDDARSGVHAVALLYGASESELADLVARAIDAADFESHVEIEFQARPPKGEPVRELFGFTDGVSQPALRGTRKAEKLKHRDQLLHPGEIVLGYPDESGFTPAAPVVGGASSAPTALRGASELGRNGTFLVIRQLAQDRERFEGFLDRAARDASVIEATPPDSPIEFRRDWIAAKMMGRWPDGSSLVRNPHSPHPKGYPDNDFRYAEDPNGLFCPFGSHIRRANPRDSFDPSAAEPLQIVNRHRILRVGRGYMQHGVPRGMLFMCLNADLERQFEFVQQTWVLGRNFHGLSNEVDPILTGGQPETPPERSRMTIPTETGPLQIKGLETFVSVVGSGYFFVPGRACLQFLIEHEPTHSMLPEPELQAAE
jgi:deferrochelatase/peroxidase EfeB